jgi:hypothetical protein
MRALESFGLKLEEAAADDARHAEVAEVGAAEEHGPLGAAVVDVMPASGVVASRASGQPALTSETGLTNPATGPEM